MSLLYPMGIPSPLLPSRTAWTSRRSPVCWGTTTPDLPSAPTPTPPGRCRIRQRKPWAASWRRSCKGNPAVPKTTGQADRTSCPVLSKPGGLRNTSGPHPKFTPLKQRITPSFRQIPQSFYPCPHIPSECRQLRQEGPLHPL